MTTVIGPTSLQLRKKLQSCYCIGERKHFSYLHGHPLYLLLSCRREPKCPKKTSPEVVPRSCQICWVLPTEMIKSQQLEISNPKLQCFKLISSGRGFRIFGLLLESMAASSLAKRSLELRIFCPLVSSIHMSFQTPSISEAKCKEGGTSWDNRSTIWMHWVTPLSLALFVQKLVINHIIPVCSDSLKVLLICRYFLQWSCEPLKVIQEGSNKLPNSCACWYFDVFPWITNVFNDI